MTIRCHRAAVRPTTPGRRTRSSEIRLTALSATRGANYWSRRPVTRLDLVVGAFDEISSAEIPDFTDRLVSALPGLEEHRCSIGVRGGFITRLNRGTYAPHIIEHVALELQTMIGHDVGYGRSRGGDVEGEYTVVFEHNARGDGLACRRARAGHRAAGIRGHTHDGRSRRCGAQGHRERRRRAARDTARALRRHRRQRAHGAAHGDRAATRRRERAHRGREPGLHPAGGASVCGERHRGGDGHRSHRRSGALS